MKLFLLLAAAWEIYSSLEQIQADLDEWMVISFEKGLR